jgi:hypothetical protein
MTHGERHPHAETMANNNINAPISTAHNKKIHPRKTIEVKTSARGDPGPRASSASLARQRFQTLQTPSIRYRPDIGKNLLLFPT